MASFIVYPVLSGIGYIPDGIAGIKPLYQDTNSPTLN